jgi:hypothetical protein
MSLAPLVLGSRWDLADPARLEPLKWVAFVAMVCDHLALTLLPSEQWLRQIGTFAFPTFMLAFGVGLASTNAPLRIAGRLLLPAVVAQVAWFIIDSAHPVNVLLVCSVSALLLDWWQEHETSNLCWLALLPLPGLFVIGTEGGVLGVGLILGGYLAARGSPWVAVAVCGLWLGLLPSWGFALAVACFVAWPSLSVVVPRCRGLLAWAYAVHLALLATAVAVRS